jgi:hypothetical protein
MDRLKWMARVGALCVALTPLAPWLLAVTPGEFKLVAHPSVSTTRLNRAALSDLFLKKAQRWPDGSICVPVDQKVNAPVRAAFSEAVHRKGIGAIEAFWQKQIFSGQGIPPLMKESDAGVLDVIRATPGAIGYVSGTADTKGAKVVELE